MKLAAKVLGALIVTASIIGSVPFLLMIAADARRYDRMQKMSGSDSLISEVPTIVARVVSAERRTFPDIFALLLSLPSDAARYARMRSI